MGGLIGREDVNRLDWDVLLLIAGGLALGFGLEATGLDKRVAGLLSGVTGMGLMLVLMGLTLGLSTFLSKTAVANMLLPIGLAAAVTADGVALDGFTDQHAAQCDGLCDGTYSLARYACHGCDNRSFGHRVASGRVGVAKLDAIGRGARPLIRDVKSGCWVIMPSPGVSECSTTT